MQKRGEEITGQSVVFYITDRPGTVSNFNVHYFVILFAKEINNLCFSSGASVVYSHRRLQLLLDKHAKRSEGIVCGSLK